MMYRQIFESKVNLLDSKLTAEQKAKAYDLKEEDSDTSSL